MAGGHPPAQEPALPRIAFIGDIHGRVLHALAAVVAWKVRHSAALAAVVQVGDFSAFRPGSFPRDDWYAVHNPSERDVLRILGPEERLTPALERARELLGCPVHFISGNHEDFSWLDELHRVAAAESVPIDGLGLFRHVADGAVVELGGQRVAVLGKIDAPGFGFDLDDAAYQRLLALGPAAVDVLVTHENPVGVPPGRLSRNGGSARLTRLIEHLAPWLHVCGHIHQRHGPRTYGPTVSYTLNLLVPPKTNKWTGAEINPEQRVAPGSIAIVDTDRRELEYLDDDWLAEIAGDDVDLGAHLERLTGQVSPG